MKLKVKTSKTILLILGVLLVAFVLKMINLYETTGGVPDTLVSCVLGGGLAELALTAWITVSKVKKGGSDNG
jgi:hypothetical protein